MELIQRHRTPRLLILPMVLTGWIASVGMVNGVVARAAPLKSAALPRESLFDRDWRFHLGEAAGAQDPTFNDASWRRLDLPHDWMIAGPVGADASTMEGPFDRDSPAGAGGGYLNGGIGWYRKTFTLPNSARSQHISVLFDGAYMNSDVWINGHDLGARPYGFVSFSYDLTPYLKYGEGKNVLSVRLEVDQPSCRWYSGAGLYRHVWLIATSPLHLAQWGTFITTPKVSAVSALAHIQTRVQNEGGTTRAALLTTTVLDPRGKVVGRQETTHQIEPGASVVFDQSIAIPTPRLWSTETPVLYHEVSELRTGSVLSDATNTPFGIRTIEFTRDRGFFLNGKHLRIRGVCDHHDLGCLGSAAYRRGIQRQLQVLKSFGCNALRTSHNPPSPELLDLCDQMGILVMDEAFDEWKINHHRYGYAESFDRWSEPDLVSMLDRDRNHPCIILWSIGNEIPEGREGNPEAGVEADRLAGICHREDPTRPVTSACPSPGNDWSSGLAKALDVFGVNYSIGWYRKNDPAAASDAASSDTGYHGQLPLIASETSSQVDSRGEYGLKLDPQGMVQMVQIDPRPNHQVSSYDLFHPGWACSPETEFIALKNAPWVAGEFVWTGFDYIGEPTPFGWPSRSSYFGIVDLCGFPKDRYYLYQSQWTNKPVVHILPMSWTWPDFAGKIFPIQVFTNADSVELFLNGKSLGVQNFPADAAPHVEIRTTRFGTTSEVKLPGLHLAWDVKYAPGELRAVARKNGRVVATDVLHTAGAPVRIALNPDRRRIAATGQDLSYVKVSILDKDGNICPNADNQIQFSLAGAAAGIAGLDNGDPTNHEPFQGNQHRAYHGLALVVLKSRFNIAGRVTLTASAEGLAGAKTTILVTASNSIRDEAAR